MKDELPSNLLFRLARQINLIIKGEEIFKISRQGFSENYLFYGGKYPLEKVDTISRLEELYKVKYSFEIEKWKKRKMEEILKKEGREGFSKEELELRRFIVNYVIPHLGVSPRFKEEKVEKKKKEERRSIWESMLAYRDYDLDVFALFNIGGPKIYKLEEGEVKEEQVHVKLEGKNYYFTEFEQSFFEVDRDYNKSIRNFFFRQVLDEVKKSPEVEFKALGNAIDEFNKLHKNLRRGIKRDSSKTYTIYAETPEKYALYCKLCSIQEKKPIYHVFGKGRIEIKVKSDLTYTRPLMAWPYKHPHVWEESGDKEICYGDFGVDYLASKGQIPADDSDLSVRGFHIALWLVNGVRGLVTSTIEHGTYSSHEPFEKVSFEEVSEKRIPITNVKRKVVWSV